MTSWICPRCGIYFSSPDQFLERAAPCPECGEAASPAEGELDCARETESPVSAMAQVFAGLFGGTLLGGLFVGVSGGLFWGLSKAQGSWVYYPLAALQVALVALWLFVNGVSLNRSKQHPLSVRITLIMALLSTLAVIPLWRWAAG